VGTGPPLKRRRRGSSKDDLDREGLGSASVEPVDPSELLHNALGLTAEELEATLGDNVNSTSTGTSTSTSTSTSNNVGESNNSSSTSPLAGVSSMSSTPRIDRGELQRLAMRDPAGFNQLTKMMQSVNEEAIRRRENGPRKTSKYKGVSWDKGTKAWRTKVNSVHVGYFDDEKDAAQAFDEAIICLNEGDTKNLTLNFPAETYEGKKEWMQFKSRREPQTKRAVSSKFRGVLWDKSRKLWRAKIKSQGKVQYLGVFKNEEEAASAYDSAATKLHGSKAILNFPAETCEAPRSRVLKEKLNTSATKMMEEAAVAAAVANAPQTPTVDASVNSTEVRKDAVDSLND